MCEMPPRSVIESQIACVILITTEQFVRAFADLDDRRAAVVRQFSHVVERHADRIGDGFVLMKNQVGQEIEKLPLRDHDFVMFGGILARHRAGLVDLARFGMIAEADRVGTHRAIHQARHQRDVRRRIDAARQKDAEGHVAHHAFFNRLVEQPEQLRAHRLFICEQRRVSLRHDGVPVTCNVDHAARVAGQHAAGGQFAYAGEQGHRRGRRQKRQVMIKRFFVNIAGHRRMFENRFDLGSEDQAPAGSRIIERLDADAVTRQN